MLAGLIVVLAGSIFDMVSTYRRSADTPKGQARRAELLAYVVDDLALNGLVDFSLRRAALASRTTHKVLLYYFDGLDDLLEQAIKVLRQRRIERATARWAAMGRGGSLATWTRQIWDVLLSEESRVLDQAIGLVLYDNKRYAALGLGASNQYLPGLIARCPVHWSMKKKTSMAQLIMAALRGFLIERTTGGDTHGIELGLDALIRAISAETKKD